jgi:tetratricopeptide (TPR) repeat protein
MTNQNYGSKIFVGREQETVRFEHMLDQLMDKPEDAKWILNVHGPGGIGKTQLLYKYLEVCQQRRERGASLLFTDSLVDFYSTAHQHELAVLKTIAERSDAKSFGDFIVALNSYQKLLSQSEPDPFQVSERAARARERFFDACKSLGDRLVVIFFDTTEQATGSILDTLCDDFRELKGCHPQILIVMAGREPMQLLNFPPDAIESLGLSGFAAEEIQGYFVRQEIKILPGVAVKIAKLSRGKPILVALTVDWIRNGNDPGELIAFPPDSFEQAIVERVQELNFPENEAIMAMAHFYRRFDEQIMAYLLELTGEDAIKLTEELSRFTFVKYRPPLDGRLGSCLLHDEMRVLVNRHVWPIWDPTGEYRRQWTPRIVEYYDRKIKTEPDRMERQNFCQERLYYWLSIDIKSAFAYYLELAEQAFAAFDTDLLEGINSEVEKVEKLFGKRLDPFMRRRYEYYHALSLYQCERATEAIQLLEGLLINPDTEPHLQAAAHAHLVEFYSDSGSLNQAISTGLDGEKLFDALLGKLKEKDASYSTLQRDFGVLCNNLGYTYRKRYDYAKTIDYYEKALEHFAASGGAYTQRARTDNNLGFVLHQLRRDDEALARVNAALDTRRRLKAPYELGFSYNVLGSIRLDQWRLDEAQRYFEHARQEFKSVESERGQALVDIAYGRLLRQSGLQKDVLEQMPDPQREEYQQANQVLARAVETFLKFKDNFNLSEALNEMGTLFRQQKKWQDSIHCFEESATLSSKIGNRYREADNLQDIGILYDVTGELDKAIVFTQQAIEIANEIDAKYLFARAQRTLANVLMKQAQYDKAFESAGTALIYFVMLDPEKSKREAFYDEWMIWIRDLVLKLPTQEKVIEKTEYLICRWEQNEDGGRRPVDVYPGFVDRMRLVARDYQFLK